MKKINRVMIVSIIVVCFLFILGIVKISLDKRPVRTITTLEKSKLTIVLDPGHRGQGDYGASYGGYKEADLNDDIAKLLFGLLKEDGYNVVLSRELYKDTSFADLDSRVDYINSLNADLVLSIHHNAAANNQDRMRGYSVYYSSYKPMLDKEDVYIDFISEQYPFVKEMITDDDESVIYYNNNNTIENVKDGERLYYVKDATPCGVALDSKNFAESIASAFETEGVLPPQDYKFYKSIMEADFRVLKNTTAPSAMIEVGFMSNEDDLKIITNKENQDKIASSLKKSIDKYFENKTNSESI